VWVNYKYNEEFCKAFGQHLRKLREAKNLSMRQLAGMCDMDYNQVYRVEKGLVNTTISMVHAFAEGLQMNPQELFDFKFPVKPKK
jgi:transcriptional regulator with XRE-family HTH domain